MENSESKLINKNIREYKVLIESSTLLSDERNHKNRNANFVSLSLTIECKNFFLKKFKTFEGLEKTESSC